MPEPGPRYRELDLTGLQLEPIAGREHKVRAADFVRIADLDPRLGAALEAALPRQFTGVELREAASHFAHCVRSGLPILLTTGAHTVKTGISTYFIDWIQKGYVQVVGVNGAFAVHDVEIAHHGETSEWVGKTIVEGRFGMAAETGAQLNGAFNRYVPLGLGLGEALGCALHRDEIPQRFPELSLARACYVHQVPLTLHLALGTDVYHYHPEADGAILGAGSMRDFRIFAQVVSTLGAGGLIWNVGSAVIMPVVIEKALAVAQNLGHAPGPFWGLNFDMQVHYRADLNPVTRAREVGGRGLHILGRHEVLVPLFWALVEAELARSGDNDTRS